ncbi:hypothetical protein [Staphylococcus chromogenes]|uniref:hypothetical protein n=1 Tax=Staphylococcus chromogenes TaxID=46126 RepID=UPI0018E55094|nr:hypothetical protein [Staphylococcus chromogenes]
MFGFLQDASDILTMSEWNVLWIDDDGKSHIKRFDYKTEAKEFYDRLPYFEKRIERASW